MVGNWSAQTSGGSCRIQLSSSPSLDLYRASASGCSNQDLSKVNAWDYRDGEVYLYQTGGAVAARLRGTPIAMRKCNHIDLEVPAETEVVIDRLEDGVAWVETWAVVEQRI